MPKRKKTLKLSGNELLIIELKENADKRILAPADIDTARSLISYYVAGVELSFKQLQLIRVLNAKCKSPAKEKEKPTKRSLYAISDGVNIKLGISSNIGKRIKSMQTGSSGDLVLVWRYYVGRDKKLAFQKERKLHRLCAKYKVRGEWFSPECMDLVNKFRA